jgi:hypothetical protein
MTVARGYGIYPTHVVLVASVSAAADTSLAATDVALCSVPRRGAHLGTVRFGLEDLVAVVVFVAAVDCIDAVDGEICHGDLSDAGKR